MAKRASAPPKLPLGWVVVVALSTFGQGYELYRGNRLIEREAGDGWDHDEALAAGTARAWALTLRTKRGPDAEDQRRPRFGLSDEERAVVTALAANRRADGVLLPVTGTALVKATALPLPVVVGALASLKRKRAVIVSTVGWTPAMSGWALTHAGREVVGV